MKKKIALIAALACVTLVAMCAPRADATDYQFGLTGNDWWAGLSRKPAAAVPAALQYGLLGNDWWAAQERRGTPAN